MYGPLIFGVKSYHNQKKDLFKILSSSALNNSRAIPPLHVVILMRLTATVVVFAVVVLSFHIHLYFSRHIPLINRLIEGAGAIEHPEHSGNI